MSDDCNFAATLGARARVHGERTALIAPDGRTGGGATRWKRITYGELDALAGRCAAGLAGHGVRRGDRALFLLRPSIESYAAFYALLRLGAVPVLLDPRMGLARILACIETARPRVVVAVPLVHALRTLARRPFASVEVSVTAGRRWFWSGARLGDCLASSGSIAAVSSAAGDACMIPFTSGSTGPPKGVLTTHGMLRSHVALLREVFGWREGMPVVMGFAPYVAYALADGLTAVLPDMDFSRPGAASPQRIVEAITAHGAQCAFASPIVWMRLVRHCERDGTTLPTLQHAVTAGAPVPADLHRRLGALIHPAGRLCTPYGATEAMPVTTADTATLADAWEPMRRGYGTCVGRPVAGVDVRIIRVTDDPVPQWSDDLCVPAGTIGEVVVGGAIVSPAYTENAVETARAKIRDGVRVLHRMGDLGRLDLAGRLWICGRKSHRIETPGGMIPPVPIENVFDGHPDVLRTAVVGVGPAGSQTPVACVEMEEGRAFTPRIAAGLAALADGTCWEGVVTRFLPHRGFPVDARHNSKILREELAVWAAKTLASEARG